MATKGEMMRWTKLAERYPQRCERVLIRYEDEHEVHYDVAWYDAGLWWLDARLSLSSVFDDVTHWAKIEPPIDVLVDMVE